jgi:hypothetical protein
MGVRQSSPYMMLTNLGSDTTVLINASSMTWKKTSAGMGVLRATTFARSSALLFLFLSMYST